MLLYALQKRVDDHVAFVVSTLLTAPAVTRICVELIQKQEYGRVSRGRCIEQWKPIAGYNGAYLVSDQGSVMSKCGKLLKSILTQSDTAL